MAAGRSLKTLVSRRRRADDDGEDEEGPVLVEDSQSEGSVISDIDDEEADTSSFGEAAAAEGGQDVEVDLAGPALNGSAKTIKKSRRTRKKGGKKPGKESTPKSSSQTPITDFQAPPDTLAMMNGLKISDDAHPGPTEDFEELGKQGQQPSSQSVPPPIAAQEQKQSDLPAARQRLEHEDHRKRREGDPAFIPTRGNFFMHDTRSTNGNDLQSYRGGWNGRGRGRGQGGASGVVGGPFSPAGQTAQAERAAEQPWKHDLHNTVNEDTAGAISGNFAHGQDAASHPSVKAPQATQPQHRVVSFSSTKMLGTLQIRVFLPGMKQSLAFPEVPWKHYTRLPDHRPPLRRDKPVRVFLPGHTQRYIFPSSERSFIFIPRQMRPNHQSLGRSAYNRNSTAVGFSSRRTSMYGGSMYAASVAASRRSSFASVQRDNAFSPVGSYAGGMQPTRPVVRLPHGSQSHFPSQSTSSMGMPVVPGFQPPPPSMQIHTFPLPQQPTYQGIPTTTVHQPRPQKAISVTGLDTPAALRSHESQPFQNQLPAHMTETPTFNQLPGPYYSPHQQYQYLQQPPPAGTPLSGIPEQAVHAPSFQPPLMPYGQYYMPPQPQPNYYYPPAPNSYQPMPMYIHPPQGYMMSPPALPMTQQQHQPPLAPGSHVSPAVPLSQQSDAQPAQPAEPESQPSQQLPAPASAHQSHSGMVAHESNGMVFYMPASEAQQLPQSENYQPAESFVPSYAMPGLPPPTPAPEPAYYYPAAPSGVYYPTA